MLGARLALALRVAPGVEGQASARFALQHFKLPNRQLPATDEPPAPLRDPRQRERPLRYPAPDVESEI
eukprot:2460358-Lingulodinium_polyedra.AAC.1